jgi:cell division protein FtsI/penicillin-binding protein 2
MNSLPFKKRSENLKVSIFKNMRLRSRFGANVFWIYYRSNEKIAAKTPYYNSGDLIGRQGVEESYEEILRGIKV